MGMTGIAFGMEMALCQKDRSALIPHMVTAARQDYLSTCDASSML